MLPSFMLLLNVQMTIKQIMKRYPVLFRFFQVIAMLTVGINTARAQNGDRILDGIGETGMIARYVFAGDARDWSRNNLHATIQGSGVEFVNDNRFGKVI